MIPKQVIEKAIEGGWKLKGYEEYPQEVEFFPAEMDGDKVTKWNPYWIKVLITTTHRDNKPFKNIKQIPWQELALDPTFWQALGKALGWEKDDNQFFYGYANAEDHEMFSPNESWRMVAHRFYDLILTGGSTDEFWKEIINDTRRP